MARTADLSGCRVAEDLFEAERKVLQKAEQVGPSW
jgi:hypothetical protein